MTIRDAIAALLERKSLSEDEAADVIGTIMNGDATPAQIGALLALLRAKGETVEEITGAARAMRDRVTRIACDEPALLDTCGTGGDGAHTFNISTAAGLVAAGAGCKVAKHGNRAISGKVGGADVLETLGVAIELEPQHSEAMLRETGFGFLFAQRLHGAMKHAAAPRRELGVRTIFNLLGPLTNPAGARHHLLGVYDGRWIEPLAAVLGRLGSVHALVVHGDDGLDEITLTGPTRVAELRDGRVRVSTLDPETFGFERRPLSDLQADDAAHSAQVVRAVLEGKRGPARDVVVLNAGAAIYAADRAATLGEGIEQAKRAIDEGRALAVLDRVVRASRKGAQP